MFIYRKIQETIRSKQRYYWFWRGIAIATSLLIFSTQLQSAAAQQEATLFHQQSLQPLQSNSPLTKAEPPLSSLPLPRAHPLPMTLADWQDTTGAGDYFHEVNTTPLGYLVWSQFPVKIYVEQTTEQLDSASASVQRFQAWTHAVLQAVQEWSIYLPLQAVSHSEEADISILRSRPPLEASVDRETGKFNLPRARSAETNYEFFLGRKVDAPEEATIAHRFTIRLTPDQTAEYTLATARHEIGHALGIWGHSPLATDALYFSQVRHPPQISVRDINTLKQLYKQPTRLGWPVVP
ncbi:peptidase [Lyngbya aestuarii]|uniref:peptidase n=1 Tax=Lyngbya aestuarii TaxID=118322 RepID=UPI00403D7CA5